MLRHPQAACVAPEPRPCNRKAWRGRISCTDSIVRTDGEYGRGTLGLQERDCPRAWHAYRLPQLTFLRFPGHLVSLACPRPESAVNRWSGPLRRESPNIRVAVLACGSR